MIHEAHVSPGCTLAESTTTSRDATTSGGDRKSVTVTSSAACPASV